VSETVSLELLQTLILRILDGQKANEKDVRTLTTVIIGQSEQLRRLERRVSDVDRRVLDLGDDLELMLKAELMGSLGHFRTGVEARLEALERAATDAPA
jgi:hypothetical protein